MAFADPQMVVASIYFYLGRPSQRKLNYRDVHAARIAAGMEVLKAIASNPQQSYFASLTTLVTVAHDAFLPGHDGEPGIPVIVPFDGAAAREGIPADPDEIDAYRSDIADTPLYTGALDGQPVAHDQASPSGRISPIACRYSLVNGRLKFTGFSAQVPLVQLTRAMADTGIPENYEPTIVRLAIAKIVTTGSEYSNFARLCGIEGQQDLIEIAGGAMRVRPVGQPGIVAAQKQAI